VHEKNPTSFHLVKRQIPPGDTRCLPCLSWIMAQPKTIRALERAIQVLNVLQTQMMASLHELHIATGLPKPTVLRILVTLERSGVISRRLMDGQYRLRSLGSIAPRLRKFDNIADVAAPVMHRLCGKVLWPSELMVPAGDQMEKIETSRTLSAFPIRPEMGGSIPWLLSGVGRAYLAFCPRAERDRLLARLRRTGRPIDRLSHEPEYFARILRETRERGFGTRDTTFTGGTLLLPTLDDGLAAIAVPLAKGDRVHGAINIIFMRKAVTVEEMALRHLVDLQDAAQEIVDLLSYGQRQN
jgi:IclR family transcriptional regulator, mhp operon transcriptional activator